MEDICTVCSKDKDLGILTEELKLKQRYDLSVEFAINPLFFRDILQYCSSFKYYNESGVVLFEVSNFRGLIQTRK